MIPGEYIPYRVPHNRWIYQYEREYKSSKNLCQVSYKFRLSFYPSLDFRGYFLHYCIEHIMKGYDLRISHIIFRSRNSDFVAIPIATTSSRYPIGSIYTSSQYRTGIVTGHWFGVRLWIFTLIVSQRLAVCNASLVSTSEMLIIRPSPSVCVFISVIVKKIMKQEEILDCENRIIYFFEPVKRFCNFLFCG